MEEMIFLAILYTVLILTDLVPVYRQKDKKAAVFCTALFAMAFILQEMLGYGVQFPSVTAALIKLFSGFTGTGS